MKIQYKNTLIIANLALLLMFFTMQVIKKEKILKHSALVLLELAPKDPRSLMQGDYMVLRYTISDNLRPSISINITDSEKEGVNLIDSIKKLDKLYAIPEQGYFVVTIDSNNVGVLQRLQTENYPLNNNEFVLKYKSFGKSIGAEAYFFEEGKAHKYENARYGGIKIDGLGNCVLVGLFDDSFKKIE